MTAPLPAPSPPASPAYPITLGPMLPHDIAAISALHAAAFGPGRFARTAYRVREHAGRPLPSPHCCTARDASGDIVGAVTMTAVLVADAGGHWLLGPLAVRPALAGRGIGRRLVAEALGSVAAAGDPAGIVILVGDTKYYGSLGFSPVRNGALTFPGPVDPARILTWLGPDGARACPVGMIRAARPPAARVET